MTDQGERHFGCVDQLAFTRRHGGNAATIKTFHALESDLREWADELRTLYGDPNRGTVLPASAVAEKIDSLLGDQHDYVSMDSDHFEPQPSQAQLEYFVHAVEELHRAHATEIAGWKERWRDWGEGQKARAERAESLAEELVQALNEAITAGYDPPRRLEDARAKWIYRNAARRVG